MKKKCTCLPGANAAPACPVHGTAAARAGEVEIRLRCLEAAARAWAGADSDAGVGDETILDAAAKFEAWVRTGER